ncbi:MAG: T9SS type A sorting domain-containing protein, partial [Flavobacteriales bacterium]|nr:T9SS type A sorting domain-containing protein [Flavobacteriales bacterium]
VDFVLEDGKDIVWGEFSSVEINPNSNSSGYESNGATFIVEGEFTINQDWTCTNCQFWMEENAKINVSYGTTFDFAGSSTSFIKACDNRWDGIYATGTGEILLSEVHPFKGSDAGLVSNNGADIVVDLVDFEQNEVCVTSNSYQSVGSQELKISNSHFSCNPPLQYANGDYYYPQTAIQLDKLFSLLDVTTVYPAQAHSEISNNYFDASAGKIVVNQGRVDISSNEFQNYNFTPGLPNFPGDPSRSILAIDAIGQSQWGELVSHLGVIGNTFLSTKIAIRTAKNMSFIISDNRMNEDASGTIYSGFPYSTFLLMNDNYHHFGAPINLSGHCLLGGNKLRNVTNGFLLYDIRKRMQISQNLLRLDYNLASKGLLIDATNMTDPSLVALEGNEIWSANKAIELKNVSLTNTTSGGGLRLNTIRHLHNYTAPCALPPCEEQNSFGIKVFNSTLITNGNNRIINTHYSNNLNLAGIILDHSTYHLQCLEVEFMGRGIQFEGNNTPTPTSFGPGVGLPLAGNTMRNCHVGLSLNQQGSFGVSGTASLATDNIWDNTVTPYTGDGIRSTNSSNGSLSSLFYNTGVSVPNTITSDGSSSNVTLTTTTAGPFIGYNCNGIYPTLRKKKPKKNKDSLRAQKIKLRLNGISNPNWRKYEEQIVYLQLLKDTTVNHDSLLLQLKDSLGQSPFAKIYKAKNENRGRAALQAISALHPFDQDVKYMSVLLEQLRAGDTIAYNDLLQTRSLAQACPKQRGMAVHQARNLMGRLGEYNFENVCERTSNTVPSSPAQKRLKVLVEGISIYPNPAQNKLNIAVEIEKNEQAEIRFFDLLGKEVMKNQLSTGNIRSISTHALQEGLYVYQIYINGEILKRGKQLIQR